MALIKSVVRKQIETQRLFNLAVQEDESFVVNGIVVHNCKSRLVPNLKGDSSNPEIDAGTSVSQKALKSITLQEPRYRIFSLSMAEPNGEIQTIIISKKKAKTLEAARKEMQKFGGTDNGVDETEESFRFRQKNPEQYKSFKTFSPTDGVSIVYGNK